MQYRPLPMPIHADLARTGEVYRVDYGAVAQGALAAAQAHQISPGADDQTRLCLLLIDVQNTFCIPGYDLYVTGAEADNARLARFLYTNLAHITTIAPTLDTHTAIQIFHPAFWVGGPEGGHPEPYTSITAAEVAAGRWRVNPAVARSLGMTAAALQAHALHYAQRLEEAGKFALSIWPYHAMLGSTGHALASLIEEAVFYHTVARSSQPQFLAKGSNPLTENYSALRPEVMDGPGGASIGAEVNERLLDLLRTHQAVVVAGQAKSHCVAWTVADLIDAAQKEDPSLIQRLYLLTDCSSPVIVPNVVDYTEAADAAFTRFAAAGAHLVRSDLPLNQWPGLRL